jgi:RimJ/RimL family protein N-acetyltransferase
MGTEHFFRTARLRARPFEPADVDAFVAYRADPDVERYQDWSDFTAERGRAFIDSQRDDRPGVPGEWYQIALEERDRRELVGDVAVHVSADEPGEAEIGITLARAYQGRGYALEAVRGLLGYAFADLALHRVVALTDERNTPAQVLLRRAGLRQEGHFHESHFFKGAWCSELLYAILDREWSGQGPAVGSTPSPQPGRP